MYRYGRNNIALDSISTLHPGDIEVARIAHTSSFSEFIRNDNEDLQLYISNFHFRQLHSSGWEPLDPQPSDMCLARHRISDMRWFYVAKTPDASRLLLERLFPSKAGRHIPWDNRSQGRTDPIHPGDAEYLADINRLDHDIYDHAVALQHDRVVEAALEDGNQMRIAA